jgi:hypothetical protein
MHGSPNPSETHPDSARDTNPTAGSTDQDPDTKKSEAEENAEVAGENPGVDPPPQADGASGGREIVAADSEATPLATKSPLVAAAIRKYAAPRSSSYHGVTRLNLCFCCFDHFVSFFSRFFVVFIVCFCFDISFEL